MVAASLVIFQVVTWLARAQVAPEGPPCVPATYADLQRLRQEEPTVCIVVFATWCAPCRQHVLEADARAVIVGAFDDDDQINKTVTRLGLEQRCWLDRGITRKLGIKSVPATRCFARREAPPPDISAP